MAKALLNRIRNAICIGASSGGLEGITAIIRRLESCIEPIIIAQHLGKDGDESLQLVLAPHTSKEIRIIQDKMPVRQREIYIAPAEYHSLVDFDGTFTLDASEKVRFSRPSIDVLFESCAMVFGAGCRGVILSGANTDGCVGMKKIEAAHGLLLVESPELSDFPQMPQCILETCRVHHSGSADDLGRILVKLSQEESIA